MRMTLLAMIALLSTTLCHAGDHRDDDSDARAMVMDAHGRPIGAYETFGADTGAFVSVQGETTLVPVQRKRNPDTTDISLSASQFVWETTTDLQYASADCSGDPIVSAVNGPWPSIAFRQGADVTVYFAKDVPEAFLPVLSHFDSTSSQCFSFDTPITSQGYPSGVKFVITRGHPEPLTIGF